MGERLDHFARIRSEGEPQAQPDPDAPKFSREQAEYLRKVFHQGAIFGSQGMDSILEANTLNAKQAGRAEVLRHIELLARG